MLRNLCSVATMYRTVLIKDLCNSKRKQEQLSTEMQKCAKTSCKNLPKDIAVLGDPREKALTILLQNSWIFTLGGIEPTISFFILSKVSNFCVCVLRNSKTPSFRGTIFSGCFFKQTCRQESCEWGVSGGSHPFFIWGLVYHKLSAATTWKNPCQQEKWGGLLKY